MKNIHNEQNIKNLQENTIIITDFLLPEAPIGLGIDNIVTDCESLFFAPAVRLLKGFLTPVVAGTEVRKLPNTDI